MITKLKAAIFYVSDMSKSLDFYTKILEFKVVENQNDFVTLQIGQENKTLLALNSQHRSFQMIGKQTILINTDNIEEDYKKLGESGAKIFDKLQSFSWGKYFAIEDIDGNHIDVSEEK